jgi:hypothetical protein
MANIVRKTEVLYSYLYAQHGGLMQSSISALVRLLRRFQDADSTRLVRSTPSPELQALHFLEVNG